MANVFEVRLDLDKQTPTQVVHIRQGDMFGTTIAATLYDHGTLYEPDPDDYYVYFMTKLPDDEHYYRVRATLDGAVASVDINESMAGALVGRTSNAYFAIYDRDDDNFRASTSSFTIVTLPDALEGATVPESYDSAIQDAIDRCNDAAAVLETLTPITNAKIDAITSS